MFKKIIVVLLLISLCIISGFAQDGTYTTYGYFYMPPYGGYGTTEFDEYNAYMQIADTQIESNKTEARTNKWNATSAPTVNNDVDEGYIVGSTWADVTNDKGYICLDNTDGTAVWKLIAPSGAGAIGISGSPVDDDWARWVSASDVEGLSDAELIAALSLEVGVDILAQQSIGISDNYLLEVDGTPNSAEYARFTANGLEGRTEADFKGDFNLEIGTDVEAHDTTLTDIADGTINENLVNTAHPWADNEVSDTLTSSTCTGNAATATALATGRLIGGVSFDGTANIVPTTIVVADTTDTTSFVALWESATGSLLPKSDAGITYNAGTGILSCTNVFFGSFANADAPDVNDDVDGGYVIGSFWIDTTANEMYVCLDNTDGAAVWSKAAPGGGGGSVDTSGTPVDNDFAVFTDLDTIEGKSYSESKALLDIGTNIVLCSNYAHPDDAITAIGATETTLLVTETETVDANVTIPATIRVVFERGGSFAIANGITVTWNGQLEAGLWEIFTYTGTGKVDFSGNTAREVYPQWWGAVGDGSNDDTDDIQDAINSLTVGTVYFPKPSSTYKITSDITIKSNVSCIGDDAKLTKAAGAAYSHIFLAANAVTNITIKGFNFISTNSEVRAIGRNGDGSNVFAIHSQTSATNMIFEDLYGECMEYLIKLDVAGSHISMKNISSLNTHQPIYMGAMSGVQGEGFHLVCPALADTNSHDHQFYLNGTDNVTLSNIYLEKGAGYALDLGEDGTSENVNFSNVVAHDIKALLCAWESINVSLSNATVDGLSSVLLGIFNSFNVTFNNVNVYNMTSDETLIETLGDGNFIMDGCNFNEMPCCLANPLHDVEMVITNCTFLDTTFAFNFIYNSPTADHSRFIFKNNLIYNTYKAVSSTKDLFRMRGTEFSDISNNTIISETVTAKRAFENTDKGIHIAKNNYIKGWAVPDTMANTGTTDAIPALGTLLRGDVLWEKNPSADVLPGWVCITSGTMGTLTATTGDTVSGKPIITQLSQLTELYPGAYLNQAGAYTAKYILNMIAASASTTVDAASGVSQANKKLLNVTATTNFAVDETIIIDRTEVGVIASIQSGASLTLVDDMTADYTNEAVENCILMSDNASGTVDDVSVTYHAATFEAMAELGLDLDDTAGNGDADKLWSADKIFDQLALKAVLGANSDITSLTGLTTPLGAAYGGTGVANNAAETITLVGDDPIQFTTGGATTVTLPTTGTLMANLEEDTDPDLGGEMDAGAHSIGFTQHTATGDGATLINWTVGNQHKFTFGAQNETITFTNPSNPCAVRMIIVQDATGSRTITWSGMTIKWAGGTAPTLTTAANGEDVVSFIWDGTSYYGAATLAFATP